MESQAIKQWLESSGWIRVDDATYQLKEDVERSAGETISLKFFLKLVEAAGQLSKKDAQDRVTAATVT